MTDRVDFIRAICAEPADDTVRLVYADWLEEHGEAERAEFIRVQCALADARNCVCWPENSPCSWCEYEKPRLLGRERELLRANHHWRDWAGVWRDWAGVVANMWAKSRGPVGDWWQDFTFTRGFVSSIVCTAADWLEHASALYWHPSQDYDCRAGVVNDRDNRIYHDQCPACRGTGRIPRPCPETAQPITKVSLMPLPSRWGPIAMQAAEILEWLATCPGIEFELLR